MIVALWLLACGPSDEELLRRADEEALAQLPPRPAPDVPPMALDVSGPLRDGFWFWSSRLEGDAVVLTVGVTGDRALAFAARLPEDPALRRAELARALRTEQVGFFPMPGTGVRDQATIVGGEVAGDVLTLTFSRKVSDKDAWMAGSGGVTALDDEPGPDWKEVSDTTGLDGEVLHGFGRPGATWAIARSAERACLFRWTEAGFGATGRCR